MSVVLGLILMKLLYKRVEARGMIYMPEKVKNL
jgi:hypothetical protein